MLITSCRLFEFLSAVLKSCEYLSRSLHIEDGPTLPERIESPCVIEIVQFGLNFVMGKYIELNGTGAYIFNVSNNEWIDLSKVNPCRTNLTISLSCAILENDKIIIIELLSKKKLCASYVDLTTLNWRQIESQVNVFDDYLFLNGKILRSEDQSVVTFIASTIASQVKNASLVFQVHLKHLSYPYQFEHISHLPN